MKQRSSSGYTICLMLLLCLSVFTGHTQVVQEDSETVSLPQPPKRGASRLKMALMKNVSSIGAADSLVALTRQLAYQPGQVVALCQLASLQMQQQPQQASALLQEASRIAGQLRDSREIGWAMGQVARQQGMLLRTTPTAAASFGSVLESLGRAMGLSAQNRGQGRDNSAFPFDASPFDKRLSERRPAPENGTDYPERFPNVPTPATPPGWVRHFRVKPDFVDRWLDTLIRFDKSTPQIIQQLTVRKKLRDSSQAMSKAFAKEGDYAQAYRYFLQYSAYKDSLTAEATSRRLASLAYRQNLLRKESQIQLLTKDRQLREQAAHRQRQYVFILIGCVALLGAFLLVLSRNNRAKQLANQQLNEQKEALQTTLAQLKTTQTQLIQSEKMASLGELTAGIAHEIQNPLNFVNNFSDVSMELVGELIEQRGQSERDSELESDLLDDVQQNLQKISEHGNRASSIIRGMLEHARTTGGQKEPTDLNALTDEYARLALHSLQAKDKSFTPRLTIHTDPNLGSVMVVQQEIGRVILNIVNNAFYAVQKQQQRAAPDYQPEVILLTHQEADQVRVTIRDNGTGIPEAMKPKVFQPFFTTKPAGQGTGLGLSLSYDIITKGHGGSLTVDSEEGLFTELTISLPTAT